MVLAGSGQRGGVLVRGKGREDARLVVGIGELDVSSPVGAAVTLAPLDASLAVGADGPHAATLGGARNGLVHAGGALAVWFPRRRSPPRDGSEEDERHRVGRLEDVAIERLEPGEVRLVAAGPQAETLGVVCDRDEIERARELHGLSAGSGKSFAPCKAIRFLDGDGRTHEFRIEALVGVDVRISPIHVAQWVLRLLDVRLGLRGVDLGVVLKRQVRKGCVLAHALHPFIEPFADGEPADDEGEHNQPGDSEQDLFQHGLLRRVRSDTTIQLRTSGAG